MDGHPPPPRFDLDPLNWDDHMGKQLAYYATPADELLLLDEIARVGGRFLRHAGGSPAELMVRSLPAVEGIPPGNLYFYIFPPDMPDALVIDSYPTGVHSLDSISSCVVRLERSHLMNRTLFDGRLWYESQRRDGSVKPAAFLLWADRLFAWIEEHFTHQQASIRSFYVGPDALRRLREGGIELA